jgi:hypothetical protein
MLRAAIARPHLHMQAFTALATRPHGHHPYLPWLTKSLQKSAFAAVAHLLCKTILQFASVTFIARTLGNEIPCGFADYLCIEKLPIARFIDTIVADLFSSTLVATCRDHISPWQSVHKLRQFTDTEITFVLASGGHNAGIISEPGHLNREYQISTRKVHGPWIECTQWAASVKHNEGIMVARNAPLACEAFRAQTGRTTDTGRTGPLHCSG